MEFAVIPRFNGLGRPGDAQQEVWGSLSVSRVPDAKTTITTLQPLGVQLQGSLLPPLYGARPMECRGSFMILAGRVGSPTSADVQYWSCRRPGQIELQAEYNRRNPPTTLEGQYRHWWNHVQSAVPIAHQRAAIRDVQEHLQLPTDVLWKFLDWAAADERCYLSKGPDHDNLGQLFINSDAERERCLQVRKAFG